MFFQVWQLWSLTRSMNWWHETIQTSSRWVSRWIWVFVCVCVGVSECWCVRACVCLRACVMDHCKRKLWQQTRAGSNCDSIWWCSFQEYAVVLQARERQKITDHHKGYELVSRLCALVIITAPLYQSGAQGPSTIFHDQWFLPAMSPSRTSRTISFISHFPSSLCSYSILWLGKGLSMPFPHLPV